MATSALHGPLLLVITIFQVLGGCKIIFPKQQAKNRAHLNAEGGGAYDNKSFINIY